ncbi:ATPase family AAA domain-containing protein 3B [Colletotrichum spinosum]|uniref:ATPase family AAA domain-containing protein 3B n=1 Tax=Colletotrichum spinosum TaxID=1347390 RepID=A0A4R8Q9K1_9PEZI|nr:ATPase family AAA domain-containing protein 3B [Colletotrichum spinosum]
MAGQGDRTIDDEAGSTVSFEEVAFKRIPVQGDSKALVSKQAPDEPKAMPEVLYVLQHLGFGGKVLESRESSLPFKEIPDYGARKGEGSSKRDVEPIIEIVTKVSRQFKQGHLVPPPRPPRQYYNRFDDVYESSSSDSDEDEAYLQRPCKIENTQMIIHSPYLLNALRATVEYYPQINLLGNSLIVDAPYRVIVHHRDLLARYKFHQPPTHSSEYARVTAEHIDVLLGFIEQAVGDSVRQEEERYARSVPVATFENYWMALRPGEVVYVNQDDLCQPLVVSSVTQEPTPNANVRNRQLAVMCWSMEMGPARMQRKMWQYKIPAWSGEQVIHSLEVMPARFHATDPQGTFQKHIRLGKLYWELLQRPTYMEYDGRLVQSSRLGPGYRGPSGYMTGRVICDADGFSRFNFRSRENRDSGGPPMPPPSQPPPPANDHLPHFVPRCGCTACDRSEDERQLGPYAAFGSINPVKTAAPTSDLFYLTCAKSIPAFLLGDRRWGHLNLEHLRPVVTDREAFKHLVLDDEIKLTVRALSGKFAAPTTTNGGVGGSVGGGVSPWGNDFVRNKGEGRIFLLHGAPGVGKTCTAECVAELTNRPLLSLTSGDLSVHPHAVENKLSYFLELGQRFGALVLLDEADVYLERRRSKDIARNGLVSVFLRALEYYRGVLFLTTNRVQAFDAAFTSRIHVALHYRDLTDADRERIWANNFERLDRDSAGRVRVAVAAREYAYGSKDVRALRWNGREIRNALQTALALAESDAAELGGERIDVGDKHLRAVVKMSRGFRDFLHKGDGYDGDSEGREEYEDEELYSD